MESVVGAGVRWSCRVFLYTGFRRQDFAAAVIFSVFKLSVRIEDFFV